MEHIEELIQSRRSVRTFDGREIAEEDINKLSEFMEKIENPYEIPIEFKLLDAKKQGLTCPVVSGTNLYVGGKAQRVPHIEEAFGYSFEMLVLYAQSLGIGTVWIGGTMDRSSFERAMSLKDHEIMPCVSPLGYTANKMSVRESMMRKAIKADSRLPFEKLFYDCSFDVPLKEEKTDKLKEALEMVRLAPSAVNKQPWRVVVSESAAHFYLKRSKGFSSKSFDMQKIDLGIALCHFALTAKEKGLNISFLVSDPKIVTENDAEYIASYQLNHKSQMDKKT